MVKKSKILVVDDEPRNLRLIEAILLPLGYEVSLAKDGKETLEKVQSNPPDMILLDVMMPEMDGYETCRQLKADPQTAKIPVIFVTIKSHVDDERLGFEVGGVDYIIKPIKPRILKARVHNHLELKNARDELEKQNEVLRENARLRKDIEQITRHDLKAPLNGIINFPNIVMSKGNLSERQRKYLQETIQLGYKMLNMINLSLDLYQMEQGIYRFSPVPVDIVPVITDIFQENRKFILSKKLVVEIMLNGRLLSEGDNFTVPGEKLLFYSMLNNLIKNALEASPKKEKITVSFNNESEFTITIHNQGVVPEDIRDSFFEKYVTSGKENGTGLGTYSARFMAETQGGSIHLDTSEENGTTVAVMLPKLQI